MTDIEKLKALALAAEKSPAAWPFHENAFRKAFTAEVALELITDNERLRAEKEAPDSSHVIPPTRGTGSQLDESAAQDAFALAWQHALGDAALYVAGHCVDGERHANAILDMPAPVLTVSNNAATRCRAEGGITSENSGLLGDSKTAETRMGSSFEGGHLGSAPAAGTDKDTERYRWLRDGSWTNHTHPEIREHLMTCVNRMALDATIDAAIVAGAHTKAGKPA